MAMYKLFNTGDIISKNYIAAKIKRYFLVVDREKVDEDSDKKVYRYDIIDLDDGTSYKYVIDHEEKNKLYPIKREA